MPNRVCIRRLAVQQPGDAGPGGEYPGLFERPDYPAAPALWASGPNRWKQGQTL